MALFTPLVLTTDGIVNGYDEQAGFIQLQYVKAKYFDTLEAAEAVAKKEMSRWPKALVSFEILEVANA